MADEQVREKVSRKVPVTVMLEVEQLEAVERICDEEDRTRQNVLRMAVRNYVQRETETA